MEFKELIRLRRSVRSYGEKIPQEDLRKILIEAQQAPSWKNAQTSRVYAVQSDEMLEAFRERALPAFNQKNSAGAALLVTTFVKDDVGFINGEPANEPGNEWGAYDLGLHDAYLILAARDAGYDTLIMGLRDAAAIRVMLGIPENEEIMSVIAVGKQAKEPSMRPRKDPDEVMKFF